MNKVFMRRKATLILPLIVSLISYGQKGMPAKSVVTATVTTNYPQHEDFKETMVSRLVVPAGYKISIAATGLGKPRMLQPTKDGSLYVTRRDQGDVLLLTDTDKDGKFDELKPVVVQFKGVHGIAIKDNYLYLCSNRELKRYTIQSDNSLSDTVTIFKDLPDGGQHGNRTMAFGPDGKLYLSVGSDCNDCSESNPEHATMLQINLDSSTRRIYARGLRNTIGFDWHPQTKEMWGVDNGSDWKGNNIPPEELNKIEQNGNYGWPYIYGKQHPDPTREDPPGITKEAYALTTKASVLDFPAHSAPINFKFLGNDALVSWHGSWNKEKPDGFKVQRIRFINGKPEKVEDFLTGFLKPDGSSRFGRPAGIAISDDGTIFISDDANGVIYRINSK